MNRGAMQQPARRSYRIELPGLTADAKVKVNGRHSKTLFDKKLNGLVVNVKATDIRKGVTITAE